MKNFTFSDLSRRSGDVLDLALSEPVALTKHGKPKIILVPCHVYDQMLANLKKSDKAFEAELEIITESLEAVTAEAEKAYLRHL